MRCEFSAHKFFGGKQSTNFVRLRTQQTDWRLTGLRACLALQCETRSCRALLALRTTIICRKVCALPSPAQVSEKDSISLTFAFKKLFESNFQFAPLLKAARVLLRAVSQQQARNLLAASFLPPIAWSDELRTQSPPSAAAHWFWCCCVAGRFGAHTRSAAISGAPSDWLRLEDSRWAPNCKLYSANGAGPVHLAACKSIPRCAPDKTACTACKAPPIRKTRVTSSQTQQTQQTQQWVFLRRSTWDSHKKIVRFWLASRATQNQIFCRPKRLDTQKKRILLPDANIWTQ